MVMALWGLSEGSRFAVLLLGAAIAAILFEF